MFVVCTVPRGWAVGGGDECTLILTSLPGKRPEATYGLDLTKESFLEVTDFDEVFFKSLIRKT